MQRLAVDERSQPVNITLKPDVIKKLDALAKEWGVSRSAMITILTNKEFKE